MKKRSKFIAVAAILMAAVMIFAGCEKHTQNTDKTSGIAGSDIDISLTSKVMESTTKYSSSDKLVALTFDDGPRSETTGKILDILEKNGGAATFFVVGYNINDNSDTIKRALKMGCEIGNHSNDHKNLTKCSAEVISDQVRLPNEAVKALTGTEPTLFRVPGGAFKGIKSQIGMPIIQWSIDTEDWKYKDAAHKNRTAEERDADLKQIADRVVGQAQNGDIILMHDIYDFTADLCGLIVPGLVEKGFKLVTVSELFDAFGVELEDGTVYYKAEKPAPTTAAPTLPGGSYTVRSSYDSVNLRAEPNTDSEILAEIPNGTVLTVEKSVAQWAYVKYNSVSGWIRTSLLVKS